RRREWGAEDLAVRLEAGRHHPHEREEEHRRDEHEQDGDQHSSRREPHDATAVDSGIAAAAGSAVSPRGRWARSAAARRSRMKTTPHTTTTAVRATAIAEPYPTSPLWNTVRTRYVVGISV